MENKKAFSLLKADLSSGNIAGAYLLVGPSAKENKSAALEFARALNCHKASLEFSELSLETTPSDSSFSKGGNKGLDAQRSTRNAQLPCNACISCRKIEEGTHPDLFILDFESQQRLLQLNAPQTEKQKEYHIAAVRSLIHSSMLTPVESPWKIFIIDGAELLSLESANALLKALEEPTPFSSWILLTSNFERILPTVRSRCRKILIQSQNTEPATQNFLELEELAQLFLDGQKEPLKIVTELLAEKKKKERGQAESFLEILAMRYSQKLHEHPLEQTANALFRILQAREELRKNANPQFVLDALLTTLQIESQNESSCHSELGSESQMK